MRVIAYGVMGLVALIMQMGVVPFTAIHGAEPELPVVLVCAVGALYGADEGALCGAVVGGLIDLWMGQNWGLSVLLFAAAGAFAGRGAYRGPQALGFWAFFSGGVATLGVEALGLIALHLSGGHGGVMAVWQTGESAGYTAVLVPFAVVLLDGRRVWGRRERPQTVH